MTTLKCHNINELIWPNISNPLLSDIKLCIVRLIRRGHGIGISVLRLPVSLVIFRIFFFLVVFFLFFSSLFIFSSLGFFLLFV